MIKNQVFKGWFVVGERSFEMTRFDTNEKVNVTHLTLEESPPCAQSNFIDYVVGDVPSFVKVTK